MKSRVGLLREVCNKTKSLRRKFNFRSFYALPVRDLPGSLLALTALLAGEVPGVVPGLQGRLYQLDAQPSSAGRQESVRDPADPRGAPKVMTWTS